MPKKHELEIYVTVNGHSRIIKLTPEYSDALKLYASSYGHPVDYVAAVMLLGNLKSMLDITTRLPEPEQDTVM